MDINTLLKKAELLKSGRSNFETEWQYVADIFRPIKANITSQRSQGDKEQLRRIFDSYPVNAVHTLKSIVIGLFFNRSIKPITIVSPIEEVNEDIEVSEWLTDFTNLILKTMFDPKSGFERSLSEAVADDIVFGTVATLIEKGNFPIKYHTLHIKDYCIAESKDGDIDYIVLDVKKTARQIIQEWGNNPDAQINEKIKKAANKEPFKEFHLQLHILPREEREEQKIDILNKPIAGYWIDVANKQLIEETGWDTMPIAIGRSEKASDEVYGTSRAMMALASANQSNEMWKQLNEATELALRPPMNVNANYSRVLNLKSGALNYPEQKNLANGRAAVEPINLVGSIAANKDLILEIKETIKDTFFIDKLKVFENPNATATQVLELRAEGFRIMGDFVTSLVDYMDKVLTRTFSLLYSQVYDLNNDLIPDNGLFNKDLPNLLKENRELKIEYINPIAQSQKLSESTSIDKWLTDVANLAQFNPDVLDLVNFDEVIRYKREILNIEPELINSKAKVQKLREQKQTQQEQQEQIMQEQEAVKTAAMAKQAELV
jgi:hypothetical protein